MTRTWLALVLWASGTVFACEPRHEPADVCAEAVERFATCGASLPFLEGTCTGPRKLVAQCVTERANGCDELASLWGRVDECMTGYADGGAPFAEPVQAPVLSGERRDAGADAAPEPAFDAGRDGNTSWAGLREEGSLERDGEVRFTTPELVSGSYSFSMSGTGDADLYVRTGEPPTTETFDCRPFDLGSVETCTITLDGPLTVHVMVRGAEATSTFVLVGGIEP